MTATTRDDPGLGALVRASLHVARRLQGGGTMWCVSPGAPEHGRHLAVEFVHPVVVGARAMPAVDLSSVDPVAALRTQSRPGDVVVALGDVAHPVVRDVLRRAEPWGLVSIWIGPSSPPPPGTADHVITIDDPDRRAAHDGSLILRYHLLWEMTQICLEHPGAALDDPGPGDPDACTVCSDEARVAEVASATASGLAEVRTACGPRTADVSLVGPVGPGDLVLVHGGTAIAHVEGP